MRSLLSTFLDLKAAAFVAEMDPWFYPHDESPATILVQSQVQSVVAQASHAGRNMKDFTDESITNTLLVKKFDRPSFFRKSKAQRSNPFSGMVVTAAETVAANRALPANLPNIQGKMSFRLSSLSISMPPPFHQTQLFIIVSSSSPPRFFLLCSYFF